MLNHIGPLKKSKSVSFEENQAVDSSTLNFDRFKRHLTGLLDRVCRLAAKGEDIKGISDQSVDDLNEITNEDNSQEQNPTNLEDENFLEEESDWISEVKETTDAIVPQLTLSKF